ncbi:ABC transporter substrate-binding protein [Actinomadura sp. KC345]|uniref:ABC transporter substrate-binding protein n=1 Tax=Actinomadura sp. KC345 TaxID=2530371 RepID=UPI00104D2088|nr:ABC transporter substrate-binding protein [Actinomadura sp. KC345]TDC47466.1 ABC transporter substrate-binding protein [Actinomadura sp. KC345]
MAPSLRRRSLAAPAAVIAAATLATACTGGTKEGEVKIGFITALTGPVAFAGQTFANGIELAVDQANRENHLSGGRTIKLEKKEGAEKPSQAVDQARQLAVDQSVVGALCCILSPVAGAVKVITSDAELPLNIYGATDLGLQDPPYVVRTTTLPQEANKRLARKVAAEAKPESVAFAVTQDNSGWVSQHESFKEGFAGTGVRDLGTVNTLAAQTDFSGAAGELMAKNPEAVVISTLQQSAISLIRALRSRGYQGLLVTTEVIGSPGAFKAAGATLADVPFPVYFFAGSAGPTGQEFARSYKAEYGTDPDAYAAQGYMAAYMMATAVKNAATTTGADVTRESVTEALSDIKRLDDTIYGNVEFRDGQLYAPDSIVHVTWTKDGRQRTWAPAGAGTA